MHLRAKVYNCSCANVNRDMAIELEVVKLDMTILRYRLFTSISKQESESDEINSLRVKNKDMEIVIKQQNDVMKDRNKSG